MAETECLSLHSEDFGVYLSTVSRNCCRISSTTVELQWDKEEETTSAAAFSYPTKTCVSWDIRMGMKITTATFLRGGCRLSLPGIRGSYFSKTTKNWKFYAKKQPKFQIQRPIIQGLKEMKNLKEIS